MLLDLHQTRIVLSIGSPHPFRLIRPEVIDVHPTGRMGLQRRPTLTDPADMLISVSGIGPKLALAVLSGIEPKELVSAIRTANVTRLTGIPGIGKKIAERIGLEL